MDKLIIVRGAGDIATGVIHKLSRCGFNVLALEVKDPLSIRRKVCFSEAIYDGEVCIDGVICKFVNNEDELKKAFLSKKVCVTIDPEGILINKLKPKVVIDAIIAKKNLGTNKYMAPITIGLGPGFEAGYDVDFVIETMRGHDLGRIITKGYATENTGIPGNINGFSKERVIYSTEDGIINNICDIGDLVYKNQVIAKIENGKNSVDVLATMDGIIRGIIRNNSKVKKNLKIADIDPRKSELKNCETISDKARCIAGGVLEAVLMNWSDI